MMNDFPLSEGTAHLIHDQGSDEKNSDAAHMLGMRRAFNAGIQWGVHFAEEDDTAEHREAAFQGLILAEMLNMMLGED